MASGNQAGGNQAGKKKQQLVDKVTEKLQAQVHAKVQKNADRQIERLERATHRVQEKADHQIVRTSESIARHLGASVEYLDLWMREEPGARRPRFNRDEIAAAAVRIADADGIEGLSMRRLAQEVGAGTMTLYHYVRTKDELMLLVTDAVMGEVVLAPDQLPTDDWRAAVTVLAHSSRAMLERHPWIFDIVEDPGAGPNGVRHFDQSMQAVAGLPGTLRDKLDVIFAVDEYVFGYCLHRRGGSPGEAQDPTGVGMMAYIGDLVAGGGYPTLQALIDEHGLQEVWTLVDEHGRDEGRFERNLHRLLDGIAASLGR
jgi:AcrR family transcriptional regulator